MELNETLVKVDQTLDSTTKKIEKMAKEMHPRDLQIEVNQQKGIYYILYENSPINHSYSRGHWLH